MHVLYETMHVLYETCNKCLIKFSKPHDYFKYRQVLHSEILHGTHIVFMYSVWISQQTATLALHSISRLVLYNRSGECLQRGTHWVFIYNRQVFSLNG